MDKKNISRKEALKKLGKYGKFTALTAMGTFMILNPQKAQAFSDNNNPDPGNSSAPPQDDGNQPHPIWGN